MERYIRSVTYRRRPPPRCGVTQFAGNDALVKRPDAVAWQRDRKTAAGLASVVIDNPGCHGDDGRPRNYCKNHRRASSCVWVSKTLSCDPGSVCTRDILEAPSLGGLVMKGDSR